LVLFLQYCHLDLVTLWDQPPQALLSGLEVLLVPELLVGPEIVYWFVLTNLNTWVNPMSVMGKTVNHAVQWDSSNKSTDCFDINTILQENKLNYKKGTRNKIIDKT
jgi:hypothetical protein